MSHLRVVVVVVVFFFYPSMFLKIKLARDIFHYEP